MKRAFSLCAGIALVVLAPAAHARKEFPGVIARELNAPKDPPCSICHLGGKTSGATVFTPFAWTMRAHGLSGSASSVQSAIDGVKADNVDSDGDGVPDWQEIVNGFHGVTYIIAAVVVLAVIAAVWVFFRRRRAEIRSGGPGHDARHARPEADRTC